MRTSHEWTYSSYAGLIVCAGPEYGRNCHRVLDSCSRESIAHGTVLRAKILSHADREAW